MKNENQQSYFRAVAFAIPLISFSVLGFEIILTRIFSVMLSYHFVFMVVSFSLLGLGLGGMSLRLWQKLSPRAEIGGSAALFALFISVSVFAIINLPIYENSFFVDFRLWIYIALSTLPFFFAGLAFAAIFQKFAGRSSILYGLDLVGATLGALAAVLLLDTFGGIRAAFIIAIVAALGAILIGLAENIKFLLRYIGVIVILFLFLFSASLFSPKVPVAMDFNKDMYRILNNPGENAKIIDTRWSAFGRTDLVQSSVTPNEMVLFVDGAAGTVMYNLDFLLNNKQEQMQLRSHFGLFFPFYFLKDNEKDNALIIGAGGGRDVVVALLGGVKQITAVEVNPDLVALVKKYETFDGGIYTRIPNVKVVVQEGRNYLRTVHKKYDLIMLSVPITKSSRSLEGFALTENFLFTVEALRDYLDHLTPEGRIVIVAHNSAEIYRLVSLALTAFGEKNISQPEAMKHIYTIGSTMMPTIVIKNQAFTKEAVGPRHVVSHRLGFDRGNLFFPYIPQQTIRLSERLGADSQLQMFDQVLVYISKGKVTLNQLIRSASIDISPTTDDSPFFYKQELGLPKPFGFFSVFVFLVLILLAIPLAATKSRSAVLKPFVRFPQMKIFLLLFFTMGTGFMMIEIALFQKLTLYIGQPVFTLTILLTSLLLGTGIGSLTSSLIKKRLATALSFAALSTFLVLLVYSIFLNHIFSAVASAPQIVAAVILFPLGFLLGYPFPLSIRLMKQYHLEKYVGWMWGVNGIASVTGSILAMIIGIRAGFTYALLTGAFLYTGIAAFSFILIQKERAIPDTSAGMDHQ
ncbi:MAG: hypothetical protein GXO76_10585 [Calditrichaeota bacterium]|nr:hypothetical protein [Calditrichota bacterium]